MKSICSYCKLEILDISDTVEWEDGPCHKMCSKYCEWLGEYYSKLGEIKNE